MLRIDDPAVDPDCAAADEDDGDAITPSMEATVPAMFDELEELDDVVVDELDLQPVNANANIVHTASDKNLIFIL